MRVQSLVGMVIWYWLAILLMKDEWRFVWQVSGALSAILDGLLLMLKWFVVNLDTPLQVKQLYNKYYLV